MSELTDEELMQNYRQGSSSAFKELYQRYAGKAFGYLRKRLNGAEEEVMQIAFLKMHENRHVFDDSYKFAPWFFTILHNTLVDHIRRNKKSKTAEEPFLDERHSPVGEANDEAGEEEEKFDAMKVAIGSLPMEDRKILDLRFEKDLSYEEVATALEISGPAARKRVSRIIERLRRLIP